MLTFDGYNFLFKCKGNMLLGTSLLPVLSLTFRMTCCLVYLNNNTNAVTLPQITTEITNTTNKHQFAQFDKSHKSRSIYAQFNQKIEKHIFCPAKVIVSGLTGSFAFFAKVLRYLPL